MENGVQKRQYDDTLVEVNQKKFKHDDEHELNNHDPMEIEGTTRTSNLLAPIMLLVGHQAEIYGCKFNPDGQTLASVGFERQIFLWNVYGECRNYMILPGHKGTILDVHYSNDGRYLCTCGTDKFIMVWDVSVGGRIKKFRGHSNVINCCNLNKTDSRIFCSGSDDCNLKIWDLRIKNNVYSFKDTFQILAATFNENGNNIIFGGIENTIKVFDTRKNSILYEMKGHLDSITGLSLSPDGNFVLSNSMDNLLCVWDIRPYAPENRCMQIMQGHQHNFEKNLLRCSWSSDGNYVSSGSADRFVYVWNVNNSSILYKLPGHSGSVNEVVFHPKESIILSCSNDKQLYLGELELETN